MTGSPSSRKGRAPVGSVVPKEGGIQWTESYCIGKGSEKADIVKKFIQYMLSAEVGSNRRRWPFIGFAITDGRAKLVEVDRAEAERTGQIDGMPSRSPWSRKAASCGTFRCGGTLEDWNDFWSEYKNA